MIVVWTPDAKESYEKNIAYLAEEWNDVVVRDFILKLKKEFLTSRVIRHFTNFMINERRFGNV